MASEPKTIVELIDDRVDVEDVMRELGKIDGITYADVVYYDTQVFKNTDRSGTEWINGGVGYGEHLGTAATKTASAGGN